jgi:hypothetical protein
MIVRPICGSCFSALRNARRGSVMTLTALVAEIVADRGPPYPRLAQHASPTFEHEIERVALLAGLNHDLPWRVVDHLRMLCEGAKLTLA